MSNGKNVRSLSDKFISEWNNSEIKDFYEAHKDELFIGIRDNYINLYYNNTSFEKRERRVVVKLECVEMMWLVKTSHIHLMNSLWSCLMAVRTR